MLDEGYRPQGSELWKRPKDLEAHVEARKKHDQQGDADSWQDALPDALQERLDQAHDQLEHEMLEQFGQKEVPAELLAEMDFVRRSVTEQVREQRFADALSDGVHQQLERLAVRAYQYRKHPTNINVELEPEVGVRYTFQNDVGREVSGVFGRDEEAFLFELEQWADASRRLQNVENFREGIATLKEQAARKPEAEQAAFLKREVSKRYKPFGFTAQQIDNLIVLSLGDEEMELRPQGKEGAGARAEILRQVWEEYLTKGEKNRYLTLAVGLAMTGMVEGVAPALLGKAMDASTAKLGVMLAGGYLGAEITAGWIRRALSMRFEQMLNTITQRDEGLLEKLSQDLVFQPGLKMASGKDRGRIIAAAKRSQEAFRNILETAAQGFVPAVASITVGLGMMMYSDWRLGFVALASAPIAIAISKRSERTLDPLIEKTYKNEAQIAQEIEEQIGAHQEIVLSGMRESMASRIQGLSTQANALALERRQARLDLEFRNGWVLGGSVTAGLTAGGVAMREAGVGNAGDIVSSLVYAGLFRHAFDALLRNDNALLESVKAIVEMEEVFNGYAKEEKEEDKDRVGASALRDFSIQVEGVGLEIDGRPILSGLDFLVPAGGVVRLEGKSGEGKTTLVSLLSGYYLPTRGQVRLGGVDVQAVKKTGPDSLYTRMAYLSQHPYIFDSGNLRENLEFGNADVSDQAMQKVLEELGLAKRFSAHGKMDLESKVAGLSGGERARLGLARVLLKIRSQKNGGVVFLDQATEDLDEETEAQVAAILVKEKRQRPDTTFVIISHRSDFIRALEHPPDGGEGLTVQRVRVGGNAKEDA